MATEKVKNVRVERGPKNLSSETLATTDIYKIQPIMMRETKKNDIWNIRHSQLNITDALSVPSFVRVLTLNSWFYVPYSKVWQPFEATIGETSININGTSYKFSKCPSISNLHVIRALYDANMITHEPYTTGTPDAYDFRFKNPAGIFSYWRFSSSGRRVWNILQGLGYKFNFYYEPQVSDTPLINQDYVGVQPSVLPLFSYVKIYCENFIPSKYADKCNILISKMYNFAGDFSLAANVRYRQSTEASLGLPHPEDVYNVDFLKDIFIILSQTYYGDDYFTSSPLEAMASPDGLNVAVNFADISKPAYDTASTQVRSDSENDYTPVHQGRTSEHTDVTTPMYVSEYIHNMLRILTKNIQLKALAGSKLSQRLYALYGSKSQTYNMEAVLLNQNVTELDVKAITSTADTSQIEGAALGQKGGQMNNYNNKTYHYEFSEFGALICVNQIIPNYFYGEGLHREMMHVKPQDFYNDRFALAGFQNIGRFELFNNDMLGYYKKSGFLATGSWGKTSAYAEYAHRKDIIMGDLSLLSRMEGTDAFHFNRYLVDQFSSMMENDDINDLQSLPINNEAFLQVVERYNDKHQFDRIFTVSDARQDHIVQWNEFNISAVRDGRNINDFTIGEDDGKQIELQGLGKVLYN